jgi:alpha-tubulin suppressor-like RCC1 family protein
MSGLAYAWGYNNYGQLGDHSTTERSIPVSVSSSKSWSQIAANATGDFTVAIDGATGLAWAWGNNNVGQLGDNSATNKSVPTSVSSAISWAKIACGDSHTVAIDGSTGLAWAWGRNTYGEIGDGSRTTRSLPTSVSSTISWKEIAAGRYFTVAINGANGLAYGWGNNFYGQLGNSTTNSYSVPTSMNSNISWSKIACGYDHVVAIAGASGNIYSWGYNSEGELGNGSIVDRSNPDSIPIVAGRSFSQIACGQFHTVAIDGSTGLAWAWGLNPYGGLGNNSRTNKSVPTSVSSTTSWSAIAAGNEYCLAIDGATGLIWGWGLNTYGNLGNNTTTSYSVPTSVSSAISFSHVAAGQYHSLASVGNIPATVFEVNPPQAYLSWSDDGGYTWSSDYAVSIGLLGQYKTRAIWRRLGYSRDRVFRVTIANAVKKVIVGAHCQ